MYEIMYSAMYIIFHFTFLYCKRVHYVLHIHYYGVVTHVFYKCHPSFLQPVVSTARQDGMDSITARVVRSIIVGDTRHIIKTYCVESIRDLNCNPYNNNISGNNVMNSAKWDDDERKGVCRDGNIMYVLVV